MNNKVEKKHNGEISLLKFLFSFLIISFHLGSEYGKMKYGYLGVEFFFIVSGFYFCKNAINKDISDEKLPDTAFTFMKKKILQFLPYYFLLYIMSIPVTFYINKFTKVDFVLSFMNLFSLPNYKLNYYPISGITWYVNSMLIIEFIIYPLLLKYKNKIVYIVSPLIAFFSFCFLMINYGLIAEPWQTTTFCHKGVIRALMDINIGIFLYGMVEKFKNIDLTDFSKFILTALEIIGYILIFYLCNKNEISIEFVVITLIVFCTFISLSEKDFLYDFCNNKFFYYLEKLSLPMYIFQYIFIVIAIYINNKFLLNLEFMEMYIPIVIISIVWGIIILKLFDFFSKNKKGIKRIFIKE